MDGAGVNNGSSFPVDGANGIMNPDNVPERRNLCLLGRDKRYQVKMGNTYTGIICANRPNVSSRLPSTYKPDIESACSKFYEIPQSIRLSRAST